MANLGSFTGYEEQILVENLALDFCEETCILHYAVHTHKIEGKIYNSEGIPIARKVCVFSRTTDQLLGSTVSDGTTGVYSIGFNSPDQAYVVCLPNTGEDINAKILDRIMPVAF